MIGDFQEEKRMVQIKMNINLYIIKYIEVFKEINMGIFLVFKFREKRGCQGLSIGDYVC